ncbi:hypothetical protein GGF41_004484, partial [Coemansia sp. RSA 2531]
RCTLRCCSWPSTWTWSLSTGAVAGTCIWPLGALAPWSAWCSFTSRPSPMAGTAPPRSWLVAGGSALGTSTKICTLC